MLIVQADIDTYEHTYHDDIFEATYIEVFIFFKNLQESSRIYIMNTVEIISALSTTF